MEVVNASNDHLPSQGETPEELRNRMVPVCYPVSCLQKMTFTWRYLYKHVLSSEPECMQWLATYGLLNNERICPRCNKASYLNRSYCRWQCAICYRSASIRHDSVFKGSKLGMRTILELLYWWSLNGKHSVVSRELECSRAAICTWFRLCRLTCEKYFAEHPLLLGGPGQDVEVDVRPVTMASDRKWLLSVVERESGRVLLRIVPSRTPEATIDAVEAAVLPATRIFSRLSTSYRRLCDRAELLFVHPDDANDPMDATEEAWFDFKEGMHWKLVKDDKRRESYLKEFQFRRLMGDKTFNECLYWMHFYRLLL